KKSINQCYKTHLLGRYACRLAKCPYLCNVFFIVLDLRLTKVGVQRYSFFYACTLKQAKEDRSGRNIKLKNNS
ncbi:hypothetical protein, partial [Bacteroides pyogenes]|uniref:hypothetical protein n=1 Tax=Bacteroides pyogenes TaxID=310300 RepID=UPI001F473DE1